MLSRASLFTLLPTVPTRVTAVVVVVVAAVAHYLSAILLPIACTYTHSTSRSTDFLSLVARLSSL